MGKKVIATVLSLKDQFSSPAKKAAKSTKQINREIKRAKNEMKSWGKSTISAVDNVVKSTAKASIAIGTTLSTLAVSQGFSEAMDMEGFKQQLKTATKDVKKAGEIMAWSVKLANSTPFETGSVIEMSSIYESMGLSAKKWGTITADMAGATSKDIIQATEAVVDASNGEFERLKEFGLTKDQLMLASYKKYGKGVVFNSKGQVVDQLKLQEILMSEMSAKFKGGAEEQSKTLKGLWSTVTGITKTSLAKIIGMNEDGTIRQGSLYLKLKDKIKVVADQLTKWQQDGTIERIGEKVSATVDLGIAKIKQIYNFIKDNKQTISSVIKIIAVIYGVVKVFGAVTAAINAVKTVWTVLSALFAVNPIVLALMAIIAVAILVYKNFDFIKSKAIEISSSIISAFQPVGAFFSSMIDGIKNGFRSFINFVIEGINLWIKWQLAPINLLIEALNKIPKVNIPKVSVEIPKLPKFAKGGIATGPSIFGEAGPEMAIPLKKTPRSQGLLEKANRIFGRDKSGSSTVINSSKNTVKNNQKQDIKVTVIVKGNIYGEEDLVDKVGAAITEKVVKKIPKLV